MNQPPNGLISSTDVAGTGDINSNFFIRKNNPVIVDVLIADSVITDEIVLNESVLTANGNTLLINGVTVGGVLNSLTALQPLVITGGVVNETISLANSGVNPGTYTVSAITVNNKGLITGASSGTIPPNDDWSDFPAQTNVNMSSNRIINMVAPNNIGDATNKAYVDTLDNENVKLFGNQSIAGIKTFQSGPICSILPDAGFRLTNRTYVDSLDVNNVKLTGDQTINGTKTFLLPPKSATVPPGSDWLANKRYVDDNVNTRVSLAGAQQTISSVKNFTALPITSVAPTLTTHFTNKAYVDSVSSAPTLASVLTAGNTCNQDINFNGFDIDAVNDIRFTGLLPTISSSSLISNLLITSSASMTLATIGLLSLASGGILSLGGGVYTTLENLRINNSVISKEPNTSDIIFENLIRIVSSTGQQTIDFEDGQVSINNVRTGGSIGLTAPNTVLVNGFEFGNGQTNNQVRATTGNDNVVVTPSLISLIDSSVQHSIILNNVAPSIQVNNSLQRTNILGNQINLTNGVASYIAIHNTGSSTISDPMGNAQLYSDKLEFRVTGSSAVRSSISPDYLLLRETIISLGTISTSVTVTNTGGASLNWFTVEMTGSSAVSELNTPLFRNNGVYRIRFNGRTGAVLNAVLSNNAGFTNRTQNTSNIGVGSGVIALMTIIVSGNVNLISTQVFT